MKMSEAEGSKAEVATEQKKEVKQSLNLVLALVKTGKREERVLRLIK